MTTWKKKNGKFNVYGENGAHGTVFEKVVSIDLGKGVFKQRTFFEARVKQSTSSPWIALTEKGRDFQSVEAAKTRVLKALGI